MTSPAHPKPALTVSDLTEQAQQAWNSIPQNCIRHPHDRMHSSLHARIQNLGDYGAVVVMIAVEAHDLGRPTSPGVVPASAASRDGPNVFAVFSQVPKSLALCATFQNLN
ncbi:hypothetical protein AVEN_25364-1 [Araneus ventricosus]|uniref:Uncharacterized protein n=1 Tax=Araneus ventricosus TaxID=182803 RepID=A0A4Y2EI34_ARAVE|nr:hypothetical protein AVEN_25364-1 [Araneus ventricosus]